jgi:hypothetical protein
MTTFYLPFWSVFLVGFAAFAVAFELILSGFGVRGMARNVIRFLFYMFLFPGALWTGMLGLVVAAPFCRPDRSDEWLVCQVSQQQILVGVGVVAAWLLLKFMLWTMRMERRALHPAAAKRARNSAAAKIQGVV